MRLKTVRQERLSNAVVMKVLSQAAVNAQFGCNNNNFI